jgi:hypothetical protein
LVFENGRSHKSIAGVVSWWSRSPCRFFRNLFLYRQWAFRPFSVGSCASVSVSCWRWLCYCGAILLVCLSFCSFDFFCSHSLVLLDFIL